jgi:hypothetical protein
MKTSFEAKTIFSFKRQDKFTGSSSISPFTPILNMQPLPFFSCPYGTQVL